MILLLKLLNFDTQLAQLLFQLPIVFQIIFCKLLSSGFASIDWLDCKHLKFINLLLATVAVDFLLDDLVACLLE